MPSKFQQLVSSRYHIYNSLFQGLPFSNIYYTGPLLQFLRRYITEGFQYLHTPEEIIHRFFQDFAPENSRKRQFDLLFHFIQYVERQIVLFDAIEDAAFEQLNDMQGKGTLHALILRSASSAEKKQKLINKLQNFSIRVVLTAHPTQFYPGNVLAIIHDLDQAIRNNDITQIDELLLQLSKTPLLNRQKPSPFEEAVSLCWYLENVFYHVIPGMMWRILKGLDLSITEWNNFDLFRIGFWPGGDRDGNPYVTHQVTLQVAKRLRETLMRCYYRDLRILRRRLTFRGIDTLIQEAEQKVYKSIYYPDEGYQKVSELMGHLETIRHLLITDHDSLFLDLLDSFIIKVKLFGFHFACMDLRQDSSKHREVWLQLHKVLNHQISPQSAEEDIINKILETRFDLKNPPVDDEDCLELFNTILTLFRVQEMNGPEACTRYIISNCHSVIDIIYVFQLLRMGSSSYENVTADVVPLFETVEDLSAAGQIMRSLYRIPSYRNHLHSRGNRQIIMLGFSDGTKDGGYLRANWSIFRAKEELTRISREEGITAIFFDGRGGPPARGGGNTHNFYASLGSGIENREIQLTIQGQTISSNFGKISSCTFNLEQLLSAGVEEVFGEESSDLNEADRKLLDEMARIAHHEYLELRNHPLFLSYLQEVTPLPFFGIANIGSRPVKRTPSVQFTLETLRAIPFVGTWAQMKQNIPGFYGLGTALHKLCEKGLTERLKKLYNESLFFRTILANSMMALMKSNFQATQHLARDTVYGELWHKMHKEYELTVTKILEISRLEELMGDNPINRDSIRMREHIVLPLIVIQQYALQKLRSDKESEYNRHYQKLILRCMFGIINAARNSA
jgi:phosphoenolpyruvate carboxylase